MGRPKKTTEPVTDVILNTDAIAQSTNALNELAIIDQVAQAKTSTLALQLGYDGPLDPDMLEFTVGQHMRRTVEAALDAGRALLLLKERVAHGDFERRLDRMGMAHRAAQRLMQACLKFSKASTSTLLTGAIGSTSKLIELLVLDDDEIQQLADEGSALGIDLDDIARMSVSELRAAIREAREDLAAKDDLIGAKNEKIDKLLAKRRWKPSADGLAQSEAEQGMLDQIATVTRGMELAVAQFDVACLEVLSQAPAPIRQRAADAVQYVLARLGELVSHHALDVDLQAARLERPDWLDELGGADAAGPAAGGTAG